MFLVGASLAIALMAAFSGLTLTRGASNLAFRERKMIVVISAIVLGGGIWSMHFVAMLGLQLPILFFYDGLYTLISALFAILLVGAALLVLHFRQRTRATLIAAGILVGIGIAGMHYIGMLGMEICRPVFGFTGVAVSFVAAVALSVMAIWLAYGARANSNILLGTVFFGLSVFAVHFIAMWGTGFVANESSQAVGPALSNEFLAMGVTIAAFVISGSFLLAGVSFVDPQPAAQTAPAPFADIPQSPAPAATTAKEPAEAPAPDKSKKTALTLPYEKEGRTWFIDLGKVVAVRAEGHYTIIYSDREKLFCPWSISEVENRLGAAGLLRTHRSYLINPTFVSEFQRTKDTGACFFATVESLTKVPVSRSRLSEVKLALGV